MAELRKKPVRLYIVVGVLAFVFFLLDAQICKRLLETQTRNGALITLGAMLGLLGLAALGTVFTMAFLIFSDQEEHEATWKRPSGATAGDFTSEPRSDQTRQSGAGYLLGKNVLDRAERARDQTRQSGRGCPRCGGSGRITRMDYSTPDRPQPYTDTCPSCSGSGR